MALFILPVCLRPQLQWLPVFVPNHSPIEDAVMISNQFGHTHPLRLYSCLLIHPQCPLPLPCARDHPRSAHPHCSWR
jgi:hypothetical protein